MGACDRECQQPVEARRYPSRLDEGSVDPAARQLTDDAGQIGGAERNSEPLGDPASE